VALADALQGLTRAASAQRAGVSRTEISRRRHEAAEIILDRMLERIREA
jgi:transcriptional regulator with XRE-family HTH domain